MSFAEYFDRMERLSKEYKPRFKSKGDWPGCRASQAGDLQGSGAQPIEPAGAD